MGRGMVHSLGINHPSELTFVLLQQSSVVYDQQYVIPSKKVVELYLRLKKKKKLQSNIVEKFQFLSSGAQI